jgi:hypothetical protein
MEAQYNRFKDALWFSENPETVMIGGAGGIGTWLSFFLSRIGNNCVIYDDDLIEEHNMGGQMFKVKDLGIPKVNAISNIIYEFCGKTPHIFNEKIDRNSPTHYFMFSAFDNMKARKDMFEVWKKSIPNCPVTPIFIDGRLELEQLQIFCVTPDKIEEYEKYLFDDDEVEDAPCTLKQTSHCAAMIGSLMTAFFTNHLTNIHEREKVRDIPFFYEFFIPVTYTNVIS